MSSGAFIPSFFFNETATSEIYTLSLHDALPIYYPDTDTRELWCWESTVGSPPVELEECDREVQNLASRAPWDYSPDRKSTRLNSSHVKTSYAVFRLKKTDARRGCP